jgi:Domain of unknown function (DUF4221)
MRIPLSCWLLSLVAISLFNACGNGHVKTWSNCNDAHQKAIPLPISFTDTLNLFLDSVMVMGISTPVDYHEKEHLLYAFDTYNKRLLKYSLDTGKSVMYAEMLCRVNLKQKVTYFTFVAPDSLLLYAYGSAKLFFYNTVKDTVYKTLTFLDKRVGMEAAPPYASPSSPLFFNNHQVVGAGFLLGEKENDHFSGRTICTAIDPASGTPSFYVPYSGVYKEHNWGGSHLRTPYTSYNQQTKKILLSLPADHQLYVIDSSWNVKAINAGSANNVCITSMNLAKGNRKVLDAEVALEYYLGTPSYRNIIYDPYQDRYYRLLEMPLPTDKTGKPALPGKQCYLIAFDHQFKYLGEGLLPNGLALDNFFVTRHGLYFLNLNNKNQNIAQYVQCKANI